MRDGRRRNQKVRIASRQRTVEVCIAEAGVPRLRQPPLGMTQRLAAPALLGRGVRAGRKFKIRNGPSPATRRRAATSPDTGRGNYLERQIQRLGVLPKLLLRGGDPDSDCGAFADFAFYA
jgi:hypothetical protein